MKKKIFKGAVANDSFENFSLKAVLQGTTWNVEHSGTLTFWSLFQTWWKNRTKEYVKITESMTLYGIFDNREHLYSLNYSLLIA